MTGKEVLGGDEVGVKNVGFAVARCEKKIGCGHEEYLAAQALDNGTSHAIWTTYEVLDG
jgi:hypothetical protein